ncbi:NAD(P)-binding protein [Polychaeton citri CBS 116435]|uniref:NAD(P)-binding protein n=1 Tax=Polychaeton citri CBS 116435 TaxID=1314669 RepID=A0A9P4Q5A7_9PEZI|nr:NAD(P)-binding protein [Polychaeton citri CBS 116435]
MSPIRVAIIGLSASAKVTWAADAHLPYLLSPRGRSNYELVALCNSSKKAAEAAVKHFNLPASTKTYGSPEDLAADPDIDLVTVSTRVDVHYDTVKPSIEAGKAVFVEWPLAENVTRARELSDLAKARGVKTMVGVQGRVSPVPLKVQEVVGSGALGNILSSDVRTFHSLLPRKGLPESLSYFADRKVGGNNITIAFAHSEYKTSTSHSQIQVKNINILSETNPHTKPTDVPDLLFVGGELESAKPYVEPGATLSVTFRRDPAPFPGEVAFIWSIYGTKAQLRVSSPAGIFLNSDSYKLPVTIEIVEHNGGGKIETVEWQWHEWQESLLLRGRSIAELYDRFASDGVYPTFEEAVVRHKEIDAYLDSFAAQSA